MASVNGLRPFEDDIGQTTRNTGRVVTNDDVTRMPTLRPTASPTNTYARPAQDPINNDTARLSEALSGLNPALARFAQVSLPDQAQKTTTSINAKLTATGGDKVKIDDLMANDPEVRTEVGKAAANAFNGKAMGARAVQEITSKYQGGDFDKQNGDVHALISEGLKPYLDQYGSNEHFRKTFVDSVTPQLESIRAGHAQQKAGQAYQEKQQGLSDVFLNTVKNGEASGQTPVVQAESVFKEFYGNKTFLGMPYQDQMKALGTVVQHLANEGKYDVVKAIGELDRSSPEAGHIGKLLDNNIVGQSVATAMIHAKSIRDKANHDGNVDTRQGLFDKFHSGSATPEDIAAARKYAKDNPGALGESQLQGWIAHNDTKQSALKAKAATQAAADALDAKLNGQEAAITNTGVEAMKQGRLFSLPQVTTLKKDGSEDTLTPTKFRDRAVEDFQKWSTSYSQRAGETWDQKVMREMPIYQQNGVVPQEWKDTFANGGASISAAVTHGGDLPESAQKAYSMYKLMRSNNAQMLRDLVPKDHREVYEAWRVGEEELGIDPKKAVVMAQEIAKDPTGHLNRAANASVKAVHDTAASNFNGMLPTWLGGDISTQNGAEVSDKIARSAEWYARMGLSTDKAIKLATDRVKSTHVNVNGWWIDASDKRLPPDFPKLATARLNDYAARYGKAEGVSASDLTIREIGNGSGAWRIVRKQDGVPVDQFLPTAFTTSDLQSDLAKSKDVKDQETLKRMQGNAQRTAADPENARLTAPLLGP